MCTRCNLPDGLYSEVHGSEEAIWWPIGESGVVSYSALGSV